MAAIGVIGYFIKRTIDDFSKRLEKHEERLYRLASDVQLIIGQLKFWNGHERRTQR